ncbi:MAG TPA: membrane protein insertase YidC [Verrucomicrobiae bacterium]
MDRKSIIVLVVCFLLLFSWPLLVNKVFPPKRLPPGITNAPAAIFPTTNQPPSLAPATSAPPVLEASAPRPPITYTNEPELSFEITNAHAHYTFSSHGGGLKLVQLLEYPETILSRRERRTQTSRVATLNNYAPIPTLAIVNSPAVEGNGIYTLTRTNNRVLAEKALPNGLRIVKEFEVSSNYLVHATIRLENRSDQPLALPAQHWFAGSATPMNVQDDGSAVGVMWYNGSKSKDVGPADFSGGFFSCVMPRTPPTEIRGTNVTWAAAHNQFFALVTMLQDPAAQIVIRKTDLPRPSEEDLAYRTVRQPVGYEAMLVYAATNLAPNQALEHKVALFAGPKEYRTLATISAVFNNDVDLIMGYGGFFGFFSKGLLLGMNWLHAVLRLSYGWAIIAITIIIKAVFWPLTQASTRSAKRMQALQPQIKLLQAKYKDDPVKQQKKMMEFWKENKINPMSGCLPTLIQMPVFIGFFYMIRSAIELRGASFLWVGDLSQPDTLFLIPGINFPFNLLPLVMGATMLWQAQLTPPSPGMDPTQAKIMRYMPLMFMVFLYNFSAGLTLYWTVQNLLSILQTKLTRTSAAPASPIPAPVLTPPQKKRK